MKKNNAIDQSIGMQLIMITLSEAIVKKVRAIKNNSKIYDVNIVADKKYFKLLSELSLVTIIQQRMNEQFFRKDRYSLVYDQILDDQDICFACQVQETFDPGIDLSEMYEQLGIDEEQFLYYSEVGEPDEYDIEEESTDTEEEYLYLDYDHLEDLQEQGFELISYKQLFCRMMESLLGTPA